MLQHPTAPWPRRDGCCIRGGAAGWPSRRAQSAQHRRAHFNASERFLREGRAAAALGHPNTVYVFSTEEIDGIPTIAMELLTGGTLEERVKARGPLPINDVIECAVDLIDGLAAALDVGL